MNSSPANSSLSWNKFDRMLRAALRPVEGSLSMRALAAVLVGALAVQGALMGTYALCNGGSAWFVVFAALKVPLFLAFAAALCFPIMRVFYALFGLSDEFPQVARALLSAQTAFALIGASLAPFTLVFYLSGASYRGALLWNLALFALAALTAQGAVRERIAPLWKSEPRHRPLWAFGLGIWAFVAVQLAWNLRPFLGAPDAPVEFLRPDAFSNAYLAIWELVRG